MRRAGVEKYYNTVPRYVLIHAIYRFHVAKGKKVKSKSYQIGSKNLAPSKRNQYQKIPKQITW